MDKTINESDLFDETTTSNAMKSLTAEQLIMYKEIGEKLYGSVDFTTNNLDRAISLPDFTSIRRMEESSGEYHGHRVPNPKLKYEQPTPWVTEPNVRFTRSGKTGQWKKELKSSTVNQAITLMKNQGINPMEWGIQ